MATTDRSAVVLARNVETRATYLVSSQKAGPVQRYTLPAEVTLVGNVIGAATETAHGQLLITNAFLGTARRALRYKAVFSALAGAGTGWTIWIRLGAAITDTVVLPVQIYNLTTGSAVVVEGTIFMRTVGAGGTFIAHSRAYNEVGPVTTEDVVVAGALDTTVAVSLWATSMDTAGGAGQSNTLVQFECEVLEA